MGVEYVKLNHFGWVDTVQTSSNSIPAIKMESPLYFTAEETAGLLQSSVADRFGLISDIPPVISAVFVVISCLATRFQLVTNSGLCDGKNLVSDSWCWSQVYSDGTFRSLRAHVIAELQVS